MQDLSADMHQHSIFNHTLRLKGEKKGTANVTSNSGSQLQLPELKDFTHMSRKKGRDCNLQHYATRMDICLRRCITSLCAGTTSPQVLWAVLGTTVSERHKSVREHPKMEGHRDGKQFRGGAVWEMAEGSPDKRTQRRTSLQSAAASRGEVKEQILTSALWWPE